MRNRLLPVVLTCMGLVAHASAQDAAKAKITDYLEATGGTPVSASAIINLAETVTNVSTPKDFVAALSAASTGGTQAGFGIAFAPGRSGLDLMAVDLDDYAEATKRYMLHRLWGSTTFSYAQNRREIAKVNYDQNAFAVHTELYIRASDDPVVAAYEYVTNGKPGCERVKEPAADPAAAFAANAVVGVEAAKPAPKTRASSLVGELRNARQGQSVARQRTPPAAAPAAAPSLSPGPQPPAVQKATEEDKKAAAEDAEQLKACAKAALEASKAKWNASKLMLVLGKGWIKGPQATDPRLSLGKHVSLALALSPKELDNSLFNLTLTRSADRLDTTTIASTPAYQSKSLAVARYTYSNAKRDLFGLAEVSNVNEKKAGVTSGTFKHAIGIDKKVTEGVWFEFRVGRAVADSAGKTETKALFNLKYSPSSELKDLIGGG